MDSFVKNACLKKKKEMLLQAMYNLRIKQFDWNNMMHLNVAVSCCMERFSIDSCEAFKSILTLVGTVWLGNQL